MVHDIFRTIRTINEDGTSVLLVEQNARYALETASRGYVLQTGSIMVSGSCAELREDARVREAYLGRARTRRSSHELTDLNSLKGKNAVVTGAGTGIGRAIALAFAEAGAQVACLDLDEAAAAATAPRGSRRRTARARGRLRRAAIEGRREGRRRDECWPPSGAVHILVNGAAGYDPNGTVLDLTSRATGIASSRSMSAAPS